MQSDFRRSGAIPTKLTKSWKDYSQKTIGHSDLTSTKYSEFGRDGTSGQLIKATGRFCLPHGGSFFRAIASGAQYNVMRTNIKKKLKSLKKLIGVMINLKGSGRRRYGSFSAHGYPSGALTSKENPRANRGDCGKDRNLKTKARSSKRADAPLTQALF